MARRRTNSGSKTGFKRIDGQRITDEDIARLRSFLTSERTEVGLLHPLKPSDYDLAGHFGCPAPALARVDCRHERHTRFKDGQVFVRLDSCRDSSEFETLYLGQSFVTLLPLTSQTSRFDWYIELQVKEHSLISKIYYSLIWLKCFGRSNYTYPVLEEHIFFSHNRLTRIERIIRAGLKKEGLEGETADFIVDTFVDGLRKAEKKFGYRGLFKDIRVHWPADAQEGESIIEFIRRIYGRHISEDGFTQADLGKTDPKALGALKNYVSYRKRKGETIEVSDFVPSNWNDTDAVVREARASGKEITHADVTAFQQNPTRENERRAKAFRTLRARARARRDRRLTGSGSS